MPPRSSLDPVGQFYEGQLEAAWDFFYKDIFDAAKSIAKKILLEPDVGNLHAAGFHLLLAHSPDQYVEHAERALKLYRGLYQGRMSVSDDSRGPNAKQPASKMTMIRGAEQVLAKARADAELYPDNSNDKEAVRASIAAADEEDERLEAEADAAAAAAEEEEEAAVREAAAANVALCEDEDEEILGQGDVNAPHIKTRPESHSQSQSGPQILQATVEDDEDEPDLSPYLRTTPWSRGRDM